MSENEKMTETEKFLKEIEIIEDTLKENFAELKCSLQKIFACECGGHVLTEKEHSYLSSIIKPFRDRVTYIGMFPEGDYKSFIEISSQVTDENIQSAEDVIKKSVDYIFEKLKESD